MILIAIGSKSRTGKDKLADYLTDIIKKETGQDVVRMSFAKKLYQVVESLQKILGKPVEKDPLALQVIGESTKTVYGRYVWANALRNEIEKCNSNIIITDMRLKEEWEVVKSLGFLTIRINRKDRPIDRDPNHISEIDLDEYEEKFNFIVENDGSLEDLEKKAYDIYSRMV